MMERYKWRELGQITAYLNRGQTNGKVEHELGAPPPGWEEMEVRDG